MTEEKELKLAEYEPNEKEDTLVEGADGAENDNERFEGITFGERRFSQQQLEDMIDQYCRTALGLNNAQIEEQKSKFRKDVELMDGTKWFQGDLAAKSPYEHAHPDQWRLVEEGGGYLALERVPNNNPEQTHFRFILKARSNPTNMSSDELLKKDLQFVNDLRALGLHIFEVGTALSDYERNKDKRARRISNLIIAVMIGAEVAVFTQVPKIVDAIQSGKVQTTLNRVADVWEDYTRKLGSEDTQREEPRVYEEVQKPRPSDQPTEEPQAPEEDQEQVPSNPLYTDADAEQEMGSVEQRENLLERQFKVNSKSWGLEIVDLTQPPEQSGSRFDITDVNDWGGQPNIQFFMQLITGEDGQTMLKLFSDPEIPVAKLRLSEVEVTVFPKGGEPHSFVVRVPTGGYLIPDDQVYSGGVRPVVRTSFDVPTTFIMLDRDYMTPTDASTLPNIRSFPFGIDDIERIHYRLAKEDQSAGVIFEAVRAAVAPPNQAVPE